MGWTGQHSEDALTRCPVFGSRGKSAAKFSSGFYPLQSPGVRDHQSVDQSMTTQQHHLVQNQVSSPVVDTWFWVVLLRALRFPPLFLTEKSPKRDHMRMRMKKRKDFKYFKL